MAAPLRYWPSEHDVKSMRTEIAPMNRSLTILPLALLLSVACSSSRVPPPAVDPVTTPTIIGSVDEAAHQGIAEGADAARTGRRIGRVAGVFAAVLGGPEHESLDDAIDRYRRTRDAIEITSAFIGTAHGAVEGAERGHVFDVQFAELSQIDGIEATRPYPDEIAIRMPESPSQETLAKVAHVFAGRDERTIDIEGAGNAALNVRDSLIALGIAPSSLAAHRRNDVRGVALYVQYHD
jgi:hypothetical protein